MFFRKPYIKNMNKVTRRYSNTKTLIIIVIIVLALCAGLFAYFKFFAAGKSRLKRMYISSDETETDLKENNQGEKTSAEIILSETPAEATEQSDSQTPGAAKEPSDIQTPENKKEASADASLNPSSKTGFSSEGTQSGSEAKGTQPGSEAKSMQEIKVPEIPVISEDASGEDIAEALYRTVDIGSYKGDLTLAYAQPDIPEDYHVSIKLEIFNEAGATIYRYISDAGWLSEPQNYDANEKVILQKLGVDSLENRLMVFSIKVGDRNLEKYAIVYQLIQEYDGSRSFTIAEL